VLLFAWLIHGWLGTAQVISRERLRTAEVARGHFVRDVAAEGTVVAAVNPTLFAIAPGTVTYLVRAGDAVHKGQALATLDSPELRNEFQREQATLDSLDAALARQQIEIRRQILTSKQQADLAEVTIKAAERELKRSQWAWDQRVISERDYRRAIDDVSTAQLNFDHARETAALERDSLAASAPRISPPSSRATHAGQLEQVMINLLKNAAESGSEPAEITVAVQHAVPGFRIEVADRGGGLSPEALRDALLPFYSTKPTGSGLGLTLCREIVEAHGGRLSLANRSGGGAVVTLWLP